jgi:hypothetical protein
LVKHFIVFDAIEYNNTQKMPAKNLNPTYSAIIVQAHAQVQAQQALQVPQVQVQEVYA